MSKKLQSIREDVKSLSETNEGQLSKGFSVLAPDELSAYFGGALGINGIKCTNTNCEGGNCVAGCGASAPTIGG